MTVRVAFLALAALLSACAAPVAKPSGGRLVVERFFEAFNRHDVDALRALYAPQALHVSPSFCTPKQGPQQIVDVYGDMFHAMPDVQDEIVEIVAEADRVAVRFAARSSKLPSPLSIAAFFQVENGKIVREESY